MKKILMCLMLGIFLLSFASASLNNLGTFKQNDVVNISQTCSDATYITISAITFPNSTTAVANINMTSQGSGRYYYEFKNTSTIGRYDFTGISDGCQETFATYFDITPSGFIDTLGLYLIFLIVLGGIVILGFSINEAWFVILGGLGFIMLGIYSINYGVVGFRDMFMTWGLGLFEIAVGAILSVGAGIQKLYYD